MNTKERRKHGCDGCHYKRATEKFEGYCGNNIWLCDKCLNKLVKNGLQEDKWISIEKENRILIMWLKNLHNKIMRFDEFKGLRGYPITHFVDKYLPKPPITNKPKKRGGCNP